MRHALVIGGSVAGLCAARALSEFFERVTVLERDAYPSDAADRPGVPHGRNFHHLRQRGQLELEDLFPGFQHLMRSRGAAELEMGVNFALLTPEGWAPPRAKFSRPTLQASRALIDATVRDLCAKIPNITTRQRTLVTGLSIRPGDPPRCDGVTISGGSRIEADFVVDAAGVSTKAPEWLTAVVVAPPEETVVDGFVGYVGIWLRMRDGLKWPSDWWWTGGAYITPHPPHDSRTILLTRHENERWLLSIAAQNRDYPPRDFEGICAMVAGARSPVVARMLELMEPASPVRGYRPAGNRWRHYERWRRPLANFISIGDAFCSYNPTNGLGLSAAAVSAQTLRDHLRRLPAGDPAFGGGFHRAQARIQRDLWRIAVGNDFRFPHTEGKRGLQLRLITWYRDLAMRTVRDPVVQERVCDVAEKMMPISTLWAPSIAWRIFRSEINRLRHRGGDERREIPLMPPPKPAVEPVTDRVRLTAQSQLEA
jgi:2-polyprenyl-6-methoxyphenol hydroxylase-like FAD-dependent oxidoreductase